MLSVERDCIDHIRARHHVGISVKTANLGKWFPPWTVKRAAWNMALKTNVSGISTAVSFAQCISPVLSPVLLGRRRPTLPLFLPLPCFADQNVAPDNAQSLSVATQLYPSSPGRRPHCFDLADFDSECSQVVMSSSPVVSVDTQLTGVTGIYGECRPGSRRVADVL